MRFKASSQVIRDACVERTILAFQQIEAPLLAVDLFHTKLQFLVGLVISVEYSPYIVKRYFLKTPIYRYFVYLKTPYFASVSASSSCWWWKSVGFDFESHYLMAALAEHGGQRIALSTGIGAGGPSLWGTRRTGSEASGCPSGEACGQAGSPQAKPPLLVNLNT